jgi:ParB-like chromosome segregation protein Spo0J
MAKKRGQRTQEQPAADEGPLRLVYCDPAELAENPHNWRRHPDEQLQALADVIGEVGWAGVLLFNKRTNRLIDGHARLKVARDKSLKRVPVIVGEWDEPTELKILATLDPVAGQATADAAALEALLGQIQTDSAAINELLEGLENEFIPRTPQAAENEEDLLEPAYAVMVRCKGETDQKAVLKELNRHGLDVRALVVDLLKAAPEVEKEPAVLGPGEVEIHRHVEVERTPRVLQLEGLFDVPPSRRSEQTWRFRLELDRPWNVGLIVGPSGSGKSTVARELFGEYVVASWPWSDGRAVVDDFPEELGIAEVAALLSSVGFSSPPSWLKPFRVLSNGEQFRVNLARTLAEKPELAVIDEFTSVVDRTVAQIGSAALAKAVRAGGRRLIAVSCHYDIEEWLQPDWKLEMPSGELTWRLLQRRPSISLRVRRASRDWWALFGPHHYLSHDISGGASCFLAEVGDQPAAFTAVTHQPGKSYHCFREHRTVCLPDFQGVGIGNAMSELVAAAYVGAGSRYHSVTSHPAMIAHRLRSAKWRCIRPPLLSALGGRVGKSAKYKRALARRAALRVTASFEYVGPADADAAWSLGISLN